jgi:hypothetical protein
MTPAPLWPAVRARAPITPISERHSAGRPSAPGFPVFAIRAAVGFLGAALVLLAHDGPPIAVLGWALIAAAVITEALASVVFLWRRRRGSGERRATGRGA